MNERLNELAELFRQRAEIDKHILALIGEGADDEADEADEEVEEEEKPTHKQVKRRQGKYSKANPMPDEIKAEIRLKFSAGSKRGELAKEFGVSLASIDKAIRSVSDSATTKHSEVKSYTCVNGHEFNSKLSLLDVICPVCHSTDCDLGTLNGEVEEGEA